MCQKGNTRRKVSRHRKATPLLDYSVEGMHSRLALQIFLMDMEAGERHVASGQKWHEDLQWAKRLDQGWNLSAVKQVPDSFPRPCPPYSACSCLCFCSLFASTAAPVPVSPVPVLVSVTPIPVHRPVPVTLFVYLALCLIPSHSLCLGFSSCSCSPASAPDPVPVSLLFLLFTGSTAALHHACKTFLTFASMHTQQQRSLCSCV